MYLIKGKLFFELLLLLLALIYYLFFVNKGLVLYDEGYYYHIADRIAQGQIPYKDFFLQFSPGYFYFLAFFYKIFGEQILVGRFITLFICLLILFLNLRISNKLGLSKSQKILIFFISVSFGFPLINNSGILAWVSVLCSLILVNTFILWFKDQNSIKKLTSVGLSLALILFVKQNLGLYFLTITSLFIAFQAKNKLKSLFVFYTSFLIPTAIWLIYFFVIKGGLDQVLEFLNFNKRYWSIYPLSYPSLRFLTSPTGFLKLLPYYLPIAFLIFVIREMKKLDPRIIFLCLISLTGFFGTLIPTSDLLHVYPFFGSILLSILIVVQKDKYKRVWITLILLSVISGFYLTFFREYYRYQPPYYMQDTRLNSPRAIGIHVDKPMSSDLNNLYTFINKNTSDRDYIFSYPFSPMLYFLLERQNPSRYSIYYPGYLTSTQEKGVIEELKIKKVKYIITASEYKFNTDLSEYIQQKKLIREFGFFKIFEIR